jgi:hypothetical protein
MFAFFRLAAVSPGRQRAFRVLLTAHLVVLAACIFLAELGRMSVMLIGQTLLVTGIIEGALLVGWRLAQMPKSQALEFILVSPLQAPMALLAEALVGLTRLAMITLAGLPLLLIMLEAPLSSARGPGFLTMAHLPWLLLQPFLWGAVTGLSLTAWAYESDPVRRWGERIVLTMIVAYLVVGVLAGENLRQWLAYLGTDAEMALMLAFRWFHEANPFGVMKLAMERPPGAMLERQTILAVMGLTTLVLLLIRTACRLKGHFHDLHYRPVILNDGQHRTPPGDHPLSWWAVKRVTKYSGRINLWLAGGFCILYSVYIVNQANWPPWLGRQAFEIFDRLGGIPALSTALVLLAAVPAAFQYGLWDSNIQDRCRRLELLLLTEFDALDYWEAAAAAAWKRGKGYAAIAVVLWTAGLMAGQVSLVQMLAGLTAATMLWALYFAVGFWAFMRGQQANVLGLVLTLGLPLLTYLLHQMRVPDLAALLPPGSVYQATADWSDWLVGPFLGGVFALAIGRWSLAHCDRQLRCWYDANQGKVASGA